MEVKTSYNVGSCTVSFESFPDTNPPTPVLKNLPKTNIKASMCLWYLLLLGVFLFAAFLIFALGYNGLAYTATDADTSALNATASTEIWKIQDMPARLQEHFGVAPKLMVDHATTVAPLRSHHLQEHLNAHEHEEKGEHLGNVKELMAAGMNFREAVIYMLTFGNNTTPMPHVKV